MGVNCKYCLLDHNLLKNHRKETSTVLSAFACSCSLSPHCAGTPFVEVALRGIWWEGLLFLQTAENNSHFHFSIQIGLWSQKIYFRLFRSRTTGRSAQCARQVFKLMEQAIGVWTSLLSRVSNAFSLSTCWNGKTALRRTRWTRQTFQVRTDLKQFIIGGSWWQWLSCSFCLHDQLPQDPVSSACVRAKTPPDDQVSQQATFCKGITLK